MSMPENDKSNLFFEYFMHCQKQIYRYLFMLVHNESDADDLLQETAKAMWQQFDRYDSDKSFLAWGTVIARNKAFTFLKKNAKTKEIFSESTYRLLAEMKIEDGDENEKKKNFLKKCMEKLQKVDLKILHLRYEEDVSIKKIAELLGRSKNGIYQTMARIHGLLHRCVKNCLALEQ